MNLKDLKEYYTVNKDYVKDHYLLFNPIVGSGKNLNIQYYCRVERVGDGFKIIPSEYIKNPINEVKYFYTSISVLKDVIKKYVESLPYHSDFYYPNNRPFVFPYLVVNEFLKDLGFVCGSNETYIFEQKDIYGCTTNKMTMRINGLDMSEYDESDEITINLFTSNKSYITVKSEKDVDSIISILSSLLKPLFLTTGIQNIELADKLNFNSFEPILSTVEWSSLNIEHSLYKQELIGKLEDMLKKLKTSN